MILTDVQVGDTLFVRTIGQWGTLAVVTEVTQYTVVAPPYRFERRTGREVTEQRMATRYAVLATEADIIEVKTVEAKHRCIRDIKNRVQEHGPLMHLTLDELSSALKLLSRPNPILVEGYVPNAKVR